MVWATLWKLDAPSLPLGGLYTPNHNSTSLFINEDQEVWHETLVIVALWPVRNLKYGHAFKLFLYANDNIIM